MKINSDKIIFAFTILVMASFLHFLSSTNIALAQANNGGGAGNGQPYINAESFHHPNNGAGKQRKEPGDTHS